MTTKKKHGIPLAPAAQIDWSQGFSFEPDPQQEQDDQQQEPKRASALARMGDAGISLLKGAIAIPEAAVGLADIPTGGRVGKFLENEDGLVGFRPKQAKAYLDEHYSDAQKEAFRKVAQADGIVDTTIEALRNPSVIAQNVIESSPSMLAGGGIGRGAVAVLPRLSGAAAGAIGEGVVSAGQTAEQIRQESKDGLLSGDQSGIAGGSGLATATLSLFAGKLAKRLGIADIDTMLAGAAHRPEAAKGLTRKLVEGAVTEGFLEELPQSVQEQVAQNVATGKPWDTDVDQTAVLGTLAGMTMGAGANLAPGRDAPAQPPAAPAKPAGPMQRAVEAGQGLAWEDVQVPQPAAPAGPEIAPPASSDGLAFEEDPRFQGAPIYPNGQAPVGNQYGTAHAANIALGEQGLMNTHEVVEPAPGVFEVRPKGAPEMRMVAPGIYEAPPAPAAAAPAPVPRRPLEMPSQELLRAGVDPLTGELPPPAAPPAEMPPAPAPQDLAPGERPTRRAGDGSLRAVFDSEEEANQYVSEARRQARNNAITEQPVQMPDGRWTLAKPGEPGHKVAPLPKPEPEVRDMSVPADVMHPVTGKPFTNRRAAAKAAAERPGYEPVKVDGGFALRKMSTAVEDNAGAPARKTADEGSSGQAQIAPAPVVESGDQVGNEPAPGVGTDTPTPPADTIHGTDSPEIDAAAHQAATSPLNDRVEPTDAQKEAGNYAKGHYRLNGGLDISIENPKASVRRSKADEAQQWEVTMPAHYGYIKRTTGADGDHVDLFIGDRGDNGRYWVINQQHPYLDKFDEHKIVTGVDSADEAVAVYKGSFADGFGDKTFRSVSGEMDVDEIKRRLPSMRKRRPVNGGQRAEPAAVEPPAQPTPEAAGAEAPAPAGLDAGSPAAVAGPAEAGVPAQPEAGGVATAPAKKRPARFAKAAEARAKVLASHFTPGNIVKAYDGFDRVLEFKAPDEQGNWSVKVQHVVKEGDKWVVDPKDKRERWHSTPPTGRDLTHGVVERAPSEPTPAARAADALEQAAKEEPTKAPPAPAKPKAPAKSKAAKIEDFGEHLAGARKDYATTFNERMAEAGLVDMKAEPLSKSWPEPDYQKLLDAGADPYTVSMARAAREALPPKPQTAWKLQGWVEKAKKARDFVQHALANGWKRDAVEPFTRPGGSLYEIGGAIDLYMTVGHSRPLKGWRLTSGQYSVFKGVPYNPSKVFWTVEKTEPGRSWGKQVVDDETREGALAKFKDQVDELLKKEEKTASKAAFDIYRKRGQPKTFIGKKIGAEYVDLKSFDDVKEARAYLADHQDDLVKALEDYKATPFERRDENRPRVGADHRNGAPVTAEAFSDAFGFRGVQFGNYVENERRQSDLNQAYDALMDLAGVLGVPPRALSLNGKLGLAFGARGAGGKGAPSAHYEPGKVVINLTKAKGAGSLGHEWWHALDNYFARESGEAGFMTAGAKGTGIRPEMREAFMAVRRATRATSMLKRAQQLDNRRTSPYWTLPEEMSARAFEGYLIAKAQDHGASNDYLANVVDEKVWDAMESLKGKDEPSYPYPTADEIESVRAAYDTFFQTVQTRESDDGKVGLFRVASVAQPGARGVTEAAIADEVEQRLQQFAHQPRVRIHPSAAGVLAGVADQGHVAGAVENGVIHLFADALVDRHDVQRTLFHELLHYGLRRFMTQAQFTEAMLRLHKRDAYIRNEADQWAKSEAGRAAAKLHGEDYATARGVDEALATLAEPNGGEYLQSSVGARAVRVITRWIANVADALGFERAAAYWRGIKNEEARALIKDTFQRLRTDATPVSDRYDFTADPAFRDKTVQQQVFDAANATGNTLAHYRGMAMSTLGRRQIVELWSKELPQLPFYNDLVQRMDADKNETGAEADEIATRWGKLKDERQLAELMHDATLARIDPDKEYAVGDSRPQFDELKRRFDALSPDAQTIYRRARDAYSAHYAEVKAAIKDRLERSVMSSDARKVLLEKMDNDFFKATKGVYFPLARFGKYVVVVRGKDGKAVSVNRAESINEAEAVRAEMLKAFPAAKGFEVGKVLKDKEFISGQDGPGKGFMDELFETLDLKGVSDDVKDAVGQLYLASLPDLSWAKHGIHRKGMAGFSQDARRAFAQNVFHGARYLAKLRYSDQLAEQLREMQEHVAKKTKDSDYDSIKAQQVVDEMNKRHQTLMNPTANAVSTALTSLGFVFHLGLSPASAMVNLGQTALVAYPVMGAKWGFDKAAGALATAGREAIAAKNNMHEVLTGEDREAYDKAVATGVIDVTQAHDLAGIAQGEDAKVTWKLRPVMKAASFLFHHAEKFNRQITFVAAFRLARQAGASTSEAYEQAVDATYKGHFDYSASNRPRLMQGPIAKVLLLFKQFGQNMVYLLARQAYLSMKGLTPRERTEARKALAGLLVSHAAAAGALGLPLVSSLLAAASWLGSDDDEPWDAEVALRNMLSDAFGETAADVMAHGLSRLTPWDISGRVGLNTMILPDLQEGLEGKDLWHAILEAGAGPVAAIGGGVLKGTESISKGQYMLGLEDMLPAALRGPVKAVRYATEGAKDRSGVSILDEVGAAGIAGQALGLSPSEVRLAAEGRRAIMSADKALISRRAALMEMAAHAQMAGDAEGLADLREQIAKFNERNPDRRIKPENLRASVRARRRRIEEAQQGVYLPKNRRDALEAGRFAAGADS